MFGLGFGEIMIILVLALVLLGPQRLPDAAKTLGKAMRDFQKATSDVKQQFESAMYEDEPKVRPAPPPAELARPDAPPPAVPAGGVPAPTGAIVAASADNVPGLDAALAEPAPRPALSAAPAPAPAAPALGEAPKA